MLHLVCGPVDVVAEFAGDELLPDHARLPGALDLVLVDVAAGDKAVTLTEPCVGLPGGAIECDHVVEGRVELGELAVDLLAPLLDTDAETAAFLALAGEVEF